ncbi:MAG TPA: 3'-5' exonuclease [Bacteroidetes bacterium]|nr:3'-5' exonuclease [Bacteroidota bacterium]
MKFNINRDLVFFDVESTGLNVLRDRIIQIAMIKYSKDSHEPQELEMLINPGIPISEEAMKVHGITPADLRNKPTFQEVAKKIYDFIGDADLAGYNSNRFDIPMLIEEFARAGFDFDIENRRLIDVQRLFYKMEPRTLKAAYKYYVGGEFENAHDALADVRATIDVLAGQLKKYENEDYVDNDGNIIEKPVQNNIQKLHEFTNDLDIIDVTQRLKYDKNGTVVFNFGKYIGQPVAEILSKDKQYYNWILNKEFSHQVKKTVKKLVKEYEKNDK